MIPTREAESWFRCPTLHLPVPFHHSPMNPSGAGVVCVCVSALAAALATNVGLCTRDWRRLSGDCEGLQAVIPHLPDAEKKPS